jgi:hypothetical protein
MMNAVIAQQLEKLISTLISVGNKVLELKPLLTRLESHLEQFRKHSIEFERLKIVCLIDFKNTELYQHPSLHHAKIHHVTEEVIRQFFHLNALITDISAGKHPVSHQRPSSLLFTAPDSPDDVVIRLEQLINQLNALANDQDKMPVRNTNK